MPLIYTILFHNIDETAEEQLHVNIMVIMSQTAMVLVSGDII